MEQTPTEVEIAHLALTSSRDAREVTNALVVLNRVNLSGELSDKQYSDYLREALLEPPLTSSDYIIFDFYAAAVDKDSEPTVLYLESKRKLDQFKRSDKFTTGEMELVERLAESGRSVEVALLVSHCLRKTAMTSEDKRGVESLLMRRLRGWQTASQDFGMILLARLALLDRQVP